MSEINLKDIIEEALDYCYLEMMVISKNSLSWFSVPPEGIGYKLVNIDIFKEYCKWVMDFDIRNQLPARLIEIKKEFHERCRYGESVGALSGDVLDELILTELIDAFWHQFQYCYDRYGTIKEFVKDHYDNILNRHFECCDSCFHELEFVRECLDAKKYIKIQNRFYKIIESGNLVAAFNRPYYK